MTFYEYSRRRNAGEFSVTLKALGHTIFKAPLSGEVDGGPSLGTSGVIMWTKLKPENVLTVLLSLVGFLGLFTNECPTTTIQCQIIDNYTHVFFYNRY